MKKNKDKGGSDILDNRRVVLVISIVLALLVWVVVAGFIDPGTWQPIRGVEIDYTYDEAAYKAANLMIVSTPEDRYADVRVTGDGAVLGGLDEKSVQVYADYDLITEAGTYEVPIRTRQIASGAWQIAEFSTLTNGHSLDNPYHFVTLTFEEEITKTVPVTVKARGVTAATGFFLDAATTDPANVTIRGPKSKVDLVSRVVAEVAVEEELTERKKYTYVTLVLQDENGENIDADKVKGIAVSPETVEVDIPVLVMREMELLAEFSGLPSYFDTEWFYERVSLSADKVQMIGPASAFENYAGVITVTTFNASQLTLNWQSDPISIPVPEGSGLRINDELSQVTVSFDTTGLVEKTFEVPVSDVDVVNGPSNATITPLQDTVTVKLLGPKEQMEILLPENITVEIEASGISVSKSGQQNIAARVQVPGADRCITLGGYSILCNVETGS